MKGRFSEAPPLAFLSSNGEEGLPECNLLYSASRVSTSMVKQWLIVSEEDEEEKPLSMAQQWFNECEEPFIANKKKAKIDWTGFARQEAGLAVQSFEQWYAKQ
jgi:hypothetical protein